ncbi:MAG: amino acid-binding protein [Burkholderiales bacterium PBB3]|nr:MAG: amino acid-binding protein [Burkholderiales bacterium PBB3]
MRVSVKVPFAMACALPWVCALALANESPKRCETMVYSANPHYAPYHVQTGAHRLEGASVDLLAKLVPEGVKLKPVVYPWKRVLVMAEHGEIDLVLSLRKTAERETYLAFTAVPSFPNPIAVFVRTANKFPYQTWADLKHKRGAISLGDRLGGGFDEYWPKELEILERGTVDENFRRLEGGHIDYFITSQFAGVASLRARQGGSKITYLKPPITEEGLYFGFSKKSPCAALLAQFDQRLSAMEKNDGLRTILNKHLGEAQH